MFGFIFENNLTEIFMFIFLLIGVFYLFSSSRVGYGGYKYSRVSLFSPSEKFFYFALRKAVGDRYIIFAKVRIADVIKPTPGMSKKRWWKAFVKISSKHFDFVLCRKSDLKVLCAIELNDKSHQVRDRKKRDLLVERACESSGLPMLWIKATKKYNHAELLSTIEHHIQEV